MIQVSVVCVCGVQIWCESEKHLIADMERHWDGELHRKAWNGEFNK